MKRIAAIIWTLHLLVFSCAMAQSTPLTAYQPGQMIDAGLHEPVTFLSGCVLESGEGFVLVDTYFNGVYLIRATGRIIRDVISGGLPFPDGWQAEVTAADERCCTVRLWNHTDSDTYTFALEPTRINPDCWVLKSYERKTGEASFLAQFSHDRVHAIERTAEGERAYTTFYALYTEANNLNHEKTPHSMEDVRRLEKEYPVAAVSPSDPNTRVNLRKDPSAKAERAGSLYSGTRLRIREITEDGWAKVFMGDTDAYISTEFLTFGAAIEQVPDARPTATLKDAEWVETSRAPYRGGGGTVTRAPGGQTVRIIGEYNREWRIVGEDARTYFIHVDNLQ